MVNINYSIIIPHKNIPNLLQRCLNSIPRRNDIQVIVVDDNSDENKVDFKHFPGLENPYIEVYFSKEGKGAGYARNVGLEHAKGKWLLFADADDYFTDNMSFILDKYIDTSYDIIYFKIESVYCDTLLPSNRGDLINKMIENAYATKDFDPLKYQRLEPWAKIIRRNLIVENKINFDETRAANDLMFSVKAANTAREVSVDLTPLYCLTSRYGSLAHTIDRDVCEAKFSVVLRLNSFLYNNNKVQYRPNIFHHVVQFYYIDKKLMIERFVDAFKGGVLFYTLYDFFYYCGHMLKNLFKKKNPLMKIS